MRYLIKAFNDNTKVFFIPGCISCLDYLMSLWNILWNFPSLDFFTRKTHIYGNEYHYICDNLSGIMFAIGLVEEKDRTSQISRKEFHEEGGKALLLLHITNILFGTGQLIILDRRFRVLKAISTQEKGCLCLSLYHKMSLLAQINGWIRN